MKSHNLAHSVVEVWVQSDECREGSDTGGLVSAMHRALDAYAQEYHLSRLRAALGDPLVSEERLVEVLKFWQDASDLIGTDPPMDRADRAIVAKACVHYRDLACAIAHDGAAGEYERGRRDGFEAGLVETAREEFEGYGLWAAGNRARSDSAPS